MKKLICCLLALAAVYAHAQDAKKLFEAADAFYSRFAPKYYYGISGIEAIGDTHRFWYVTQTPRGREFFEIDADAGTVCPAFDHRRLADSLARHLGRETNPYDLPFYRLAYEENGRGFSFETGGNRYTWSPGGEELTCRPVQQSPARNYWGGVFRENAKTRVPSPDGKKEAYISEGNLWVKDLASGETKALSRDGSAGEYYSSNIYWSPDSKKIACCKYRPAEVRKLLLVSSSPAGQLQPETEEYDYIKPGDALPVRRPHLFLAEEGKNIECALPDADKMYSVDAIRWDPESRFFTFDGNRRGHQRYTIYAADAENGALREVVDERSSTFVRYSAQYKHWFENGNELLWISERDGWRHLYLYDALTGTVKKQLTEGEWIVKSVVHVDEKNRSLIFIGCGMDKGEDPYLEKYYRLDIDRGKITPLTPENADHKVTFSRDYACFVDSYSRVDLPPVIAVRSAADGKIVAKPEHQPDISAAQEAGWRMPAVFSAKGRDGETDIWGMIVLPTDFDPAKKYPVIEYIYAGPHDSFVPKSFAIAHTMSALAEMGFITVQIDGMGTAGRSKAFHDVCWKNLKDGGFPDRIAWMKAAAEQYPQMDLERVGIYGTSAGGQNALAALLFHPEFYKVGVSACGCHDNRMDKIWWNEQWMGYPVGPEYEACSNVANAGRLQGKLMLILGELDNNVDPSSTLQVVDALIKNKKDFELVMLPGQRHTGGGEFGERKRREFFLKNLLGIDPPQWNAGN